jgi:preprotein translocase subunit SecB
LELANYKGHDIKLEFETEGVFFHENSTYDLFLVIKAFNLNQLPFVNIRSIGTFKFEHVTTVETIPDYFYSNSIAILFPYIRAYISILTTQANVPGLILPTLNLTSLEEGLKKRTTVK